MPAGAEIKPVEDAGEADTGGIGKPEDKDPAPIIRDRPAREIVEQLI